MATDDDRLASDELEEALEEEDEHLNFLQRNVQIRYILAFMGFLSFVILNMLRVNMSVAIVCMVDWKSLPDESGNRACSYSENVTVRSHSEDGPLKIHTDIQGHILAGYFYGLLLVQYLGVVIAEKLSAKWLLLAGTLISSLCTVLIPVSANAEAIIVILLQIIKGIGQGFVIPAFGVLMGKWVPQSERFYTMCLIGSGIPFGGFLGTYTSGVICKAENLGWEYIFYIFGGIGFIWCIIWIIMIYESPLTHPYITHHEMIRILRSQVIVPQERASVPIKYILKSSPVWAYIIVGFASYWALSIYTTVIPTFLGTVLKFEIEMNGVWSSLPYVMEMVLFIYSCVLNDRLKKVGRVRETKIHKWSIVIGLLGFAIFMLAIPFSGCHRLFTVTNLVCALGFCGIIFASTSYIPTDLTPRYAGVLCSIMNTFGATSGIIVPTMMGYITTEKRTMWEWQILFYLSFVIAIVALIIYLVFGSSQVQEWDDPAYRGLQPSQEQELVVQVDRTPTGEIDITVGERAGAPPTPEENK